MRRGRSKHTRPPREEGASERAGGRGPGLRVGALRVRAPSWRGWRGGGAAQRRKPARGDKRLHGDMPQSLAAARRVGALAMLP